MATPTSVRRSVRGHVCRRRSGRSARAEGNRVKRIAPRPQPLANTTLGDSFPRFDRRPLLSVSPIRANPGIPIEQRPPEQILGTAEFSANAAICSSPRPPNRDKRRATWQRQARHRAPDFDLPTDSDGRVRLSALKGKVIVLYFYPADDTEGCTLEAIDFTRDTAQVRGRRRGRHWRLAGFDPVPRPLSGKARIDRPARRRPGPQGDPAIRPVGREDDVRKKIYGGRTRDVSHRSRRQDHQGLAQGPRQGPRRGCRCCRPGALVRQEFVNLNPF